MVIKLRSRLYSIFLICGTLLIVADGQSTLKDLGSVMFFFAAEVKKEEKEG